jgi:hypothetical protein
MRDRHRGQRGQSLPTVMVIVLLVSLLAGALATAASGALAQQATSIRQVSGALSEQTAVEPAAAAVDAQGCGNQTRGASSSPQTPAPSSRPSSTPIPSPSSTSTLKASSTPTPSSTPIPSPSVRPHGGGGLTLIDQQTGMFSSRTFSGSPWAGTGCMETPAVALDSIRRTTVSGGCTPISLLTSTDPEELAVWTEVQVKDATGPSASLQVGDAGSCPQSPSSTCKAEVSQVSGSILQIGFDCQISTGQSNGGQQRGNQEGGSTLWLRVDGVTVVNTATTVRYAPVSDRGSRVTAVVAPIPDSSSYEVADIGMGASLSLLSQRKLT